MKAVVCVFLAGAACGVNATKASPIEKAVQLLSDLQAKIIAEGAEAQKVYEEFAEFCEDRSKQLSFDIKTGESEAAEMKATIAKESALMGSLDAKIEEAAASIATDEADLKAATMIRDKEAKDFGLESKELTEIIDMLERAIGILERETDSGASMLQAKNAGSVAQALSVVVQAAALSAKDAAKLTALVQESHQAADEAADEVLGAPAAAVYEGHSGDIIETLESLLEKAKSQLADARKKETAAIHAFDMLKQSLEDSIRFATKDMDAAKKGLAASSETKATTEGNLDVTSKDLGVDTKSLADLHQDCMTKAQNFEAGVKNRDEEIKALAAAKKAIEENTEGAEKITYGLSQVSFVQTQRSSLASRTDLAKVKAVRLLRDLARQQHSAALAQLAARVAAAARTGAAQGDDPFGKVKGLISDMITKLEEEADADATHKAYCDKELSETKAKKAEKDASIEKLSSKIEQMTTRSTLLKEEVAALQKSLAELASAQAEMDKLRSAENEDYLRNKADMEQGLEGIKLALKLLREYYAQASGAHEGAGSSIIGLLEVCESDLSKTLAEIVATEESAQSAYVTESKENEIEKTSKTQDVKYKSKEAAGLDEAVAEATSDRSAVQTELDAVLEYLASLNKQCIAKAEIYEERKARREAELAGLKQALSVLEDETAFVQRGERHALRGPQPHRFTA